MPLLSFVLALSVAQTEPAQVLVLPLQSEGQAGLEAWKQLTKALEKDQKKLQISTALQKQQHDFLVGPAREQARDCAGNVQCLAEIGATLGADILITGKVEPDYVELTVVLVKYQQMLGALRSPPKVAKKALKAKTQAAGDELAKLLKDRDKNLPPPPPPPPPPPVIVEGTLLIDKAELNGVREVRVDGTPLAFMGDGSMRWDGPPGSHSLVAQRSDGTSLTRDIVVEPGLITNVRLEFPALAPPPPAATESEQVTGQWWFWTSLGAAVAVGAATAVILAGGEKGGPSLPAETGTIRGSY